MINRYGRDMVRDIKSIIRREIEFYVESSTQPPGAPPRPPPTVIRSARKSQQRRRRNTTSAKSGAISPFKNTRAHRRIKTDGDVLLQEDIALTKIRRFESEKEYSMHKKESSSLMLYREQSKRTSLMLHTVDFSSLESEEDGESMYVTSYEKKSKIAQSQYKQVQNHATSSSSTRAKEFDRRIIL